MFFSVETPPEMPWQDDDLVSSSRTIAPRRNGPIGTSYRMTSECLQPLSASSWSMPPGSLLPRGPGLKRRPDSLTCDRQKPKPVPNHHTKANQRPKQLLSLFKALLPSPAPRGRGPMPRSKRRPKAEASKPKASKGPKFKKSLPIPPGTSGPRPFLLALSLTRSNTSKRSAAKG